MHNYLFFNSNHRREFQNELHTEMNSELEVSIGSLKQIQSLWCGVKKRNQICGSDGEYTNDHNNAEQVDEGHLEI